MVPVSPGYYAYTGEGTQKQQFLSFSESTMLTKIFGGKNVLAETVEVLVGVQLLGLRSTTLAGC